MNNVPMLKNTKLLNYDAVVLGATTGGFFYDVGVRVKSCRHIMCGYREPPYRDCWIMVSYNNTSDSYYSNQWKQHEKKGCQPKWCVVDNGKAPKTIPGVKLAKCKRTYFTAYTNEELANPATNVELVALKLDIAVEDERPCNSVVAVYDLLNDKWHNDKWWTITPNGHLALHAYRHPDVPPREVQGIDAVIAKVKVAL